MVDDESDLELLMLQRFRRRIRKGEYEFLFARNGVEALQVLQENPDIRLVLSDINMPEMDGLTLLAQLGMANPEICAVIISAYGDMANIRTAMNRGAFDFVTKPIDFNDLQITIEKTLRHINLIEQALASRDRLVSLKQELVVAKSVQTSALPAALPQSKYYDLHGQMITAPGSRGRLLRLFQAGRVSDRDGGRRCLRKRRPGGTLHDGHPGITQVGRAQSRDARRLPGRGQRAAQRE